MPYLCGLWRFANAYYKLIIRGGKTVGPDSKLRCQAIIDQSVAAREILYQDNDALSIVETSIDQFVTNNELSSESFGNLKQYMQDYKMLISTMRKANDSDIDDFAFLVFVIGNKDIDGAAILDQKEIARQGKESAEQSAQNCRNWAKMMFMDTVSAANLRYQAQVYDNTADNWLTIYNWCVDQEKAYDLLESNTKRLFQLSAMMREAVIAGLSDMNMAIKEDGKYSPKKNAYWRKRIEFLIVNAQMCERLFALGYTSDEIVWLQNEGVELTDKDFENLRASVHIENLFLSDNKRYIFHGGKIYVIYVPVGDQVVITSGWKVVTKKEIVDWDFDILSGFTGMELESGLEKEEVYTVNPIQKLGSDVISLKDKNVKEAVGFEVLMGLRNFAISASNKTEVTFNFEVNGNGSGRRVTITTGDAKTRMRYQDIAGTYVNTYMEASQSDVRSQRWTSECAQGVYKAATGEDVPDKDATYTIIGRIDEQHANSKISGYLSYRDDGELMFTPKIFPGDQAQIATCQFGTGWFVEPIYDFTDKLETPSVVDEKTKILFEEGLKGENRKWPIG